MDFYNTASVAQLFSVTDQTIKNWAREFAAYLSPTATPEKGKKRIFTTDDLKVFALVYEYNRRGFGQEAAHGALKIGQRGDIPSGASALTTTAPQHVLALLQVELENRDRLIEELRSDRERERGKVELLEKMLNQKDEAIQRLYETIAKLKAKGDSSENT